MRLCLVSDLHGHLPAIPEGVDALLIGGDICPVVDHSTEYQATWLDTTFRRWLEGLSVPVVAVAGNHDLVFQRAPGLVPDLPWDYLQDSGCDLGGLSVWGSPWQPAYGNWAFNATEERLRHRWRSVPDGTDILLLHGPPRGFGDFSNDSFVHTGSPSLYDRIVEVSPRLVVCGHIHEGRGTYAIGDATVVNAAILDEHYFPAHGPIVFELEGRGRWPVHCNRPSDAA